MTRRARAVVALATLVVAWSSALATAAAHPLGNFTVNQHAEFVASGSELYLRFDLDLAEVPTVQIGEEVRRDGYGDLIAADLDVQLDGESAVLELLDEQARDRDGAGSLETIRYQAIYRVEGSGSELSFANGLLDERLGWREVVARAADGATLAASNVSETSVSDGLDGYPKDRLKSPLDIRSATVELDRGDGDGTPPELDVAAASDTSDEVAGSDGGGSRESGFEALLDGGELSVGAAVLALLVSMFWGAAHALSPGHGKAVVTGYLIGTRGRPRDAVILGGVVTATHTAGVFALGAITLVLSQYFVPEQLYPWLSLASALLIAGVGAAMLQRWRRTGVVPDGHSHAAHGHSHGHGHSHASSHAQAPAEPAAAAHAEPAAEAHAHAHASTAIRAVEAEGGSTRPPRAVAVSVAPGGGDHDDHVALTPTPAPADNDGITRRGIIGMGIAAGILPCPSALIVLLSAIALDRLVFGFALILAFSVGLAITITMIGLVAVFAQARFDRTSFNGGFVRMMPVISAALITGVGVVLAVRAAIDIVNA